MLLSNVIYINETFRRFKNCTKNEYIYDRFSYLKVLSKNKKEDWNISLEKCLDISNVCFYLLKKHQWQWVRIKRPDSL